MDKKTVLEKLNFNEFYKTFLPSLKENDNGQAMALCPFHDDHDPSLSVNLSNGLYHCFGCGAKGDVFKFYQDLKGVDFKTALREIGCMVGIDAGQGSPLGKVVATYEYKDPDGKTLYIKERIEPGKNGRSKEFVFKHLKGSQWVMGRGCNPVPYNLPELVNAKEIIIVEGEGKVEALREWGFVATSLDSGAQSPWREDYLPYFQDKDSVIILPDNDAPGREYAQKIASALYGKVGQIKVVELPALGEGEDIIDWEEKGGTKEELLRLIEETPAWSPNSIPAHIESDLARIESWTPRPIGQLKDVPPIAWLWEGYLARGRITELVGLWKSGKTTLVTHLLREMALEGALAGKKVSRGKVLIISEEDPGEWKDRKEEYNLPGGIDLICLPFLAKPTWKEWEAFIAHINSLVPSSYDLVIMDSIANLWPLFDENNNAEIVKALLPLRRWTKNGVSVLIIHHPRKGDAQEGQASRGGGSLPGFVDILLEFRRYDPGHEDNRRVIKGYSRRKETPREVVIELTDEGYELLGTKSETKEAERLETLQSLLPTTPPGVTGEEVKENWPSEPRPGVRTIKADLEALHRKERIERKGDGKRGDPHRYWLKNSIPASSNTIVQETNLNML